MRYRFWGDKTKYRDKSYFEKKNVNKSFFDNLIKKSLVAVSFFFSGCWGLGLGVVLLERDSAAPRSPMPIVSVATKGQRLLLKSYRWDRKQYQDNAMVYGPFIERVRNGNYPWIWSNLTVSYISGPKSYLASQETGPQTQLALLGALKVHNFTNYVKISC